MTKLSALVTACTVVRLVTTATAERRNPPKPLSEHATNFKPDVNEIKAEAKRRSDAGDFAGALLYYNQQMENVRQEFARLRIAEYEAVREVVQHPRLAAEVGPVLPTQGRDSDNKYATYEAPAEMVYESLDWQEVSSYGDTSKDLSVTDGGKKVGIHLNARSLVGVGAGRSRIEVQPKTTWKHGDPAGKAASDWNEVNRLLNQ
jgi:hypothetical protein